MTDPFKTIIDGLPAAVQAEADMIEHALRVLATDPTKLIARIEQLVGVVEPTPRRPRRKRPK